MSILATMPPKASSASSPCSAAPTQYFTMPTRPSPSSTPRPLILLLPRRTERNIRPGEPGAPERVGPTVTREVALPLKKEHEAPSTKVRHRMEGPPREERRQQSWSGPSTVTRARRARFPTQTEGAACRADPPGSGPRALLRPPNTGDKLRRARTPKAVHGLHNTVATAELHASLQLQPPFVCFIPSLGGAHSILH